MKRFNNTSDDRKVAVSTFAFSFSVEKSTGNGIFDVYVCVGEGILQKADLARRSFLLLSCGYDPF